MGSYFVKVFIYHFSPPMDTLLPGFAFFQESTEILLQSYWLRAVSVHLKSVPIWDLYWYVSLLVKNQKKTPKFGW